MSKKKKKKLINKRHVGFLSADIVNSFFHLRLIAKQQNLFLALSWKACLEYFLKLFMHQAR